MSATLHSIICVDSLQLGAKKAEVGVPARKHLHCPVMEDDTPKSERTSRLHTENQFVLPIITTTLYAEGVHKLFREKTHNVKNNFEKPFTFLTKQFQMPYFVIKISDMAYLQSVK